MTHKEKYTADAVLNRGYGILDEWKKKKLTSRGIVSAVERVAKAINEKSSKKARTEALSYLFALDLHIKEKYNTFLRFLLLYFLWRRETRALNRLKNLLRISDGVEIRAAIELELKRLREDLETEKSDGSDDEVHGGKRNSKANDESVTSKENQKNSAKDENINESSDSDANENSEEKSEDAVEEKSNEKQTDEQKTVKEAPQEETQNEVQKEKQTQEEQSNIKEENNGNEKKSEPSTDKNKQPSSYNNAVDFAFFDDDSASESKPEEDNSMEEFIIDEIRNRRNSNANKASEDVKSDTEANDNKPNDNEIHDDAKSKNTDKEHWYDNTASNDKSEQYDFGETELNYPQANEGLQEEQNVQQEMKITDADSRVAIQVDITLDKENEMRRNISNSMSEEAIIAIYEQQATTMREQLKVASAEFGIDAPVEIIGKHEPPKVDKQTLIINMK